MPNITISISDEDVDRIAKRFALKLAETLNEVRNQKPMQPEAQQPPAPRTPPAEWLTLGDVQRMFQVSRSTLYRWTHEEGMPVRRVGGVTRLPADKVREWAEKRSIATPSQQKGNSQ